ncbi:hypothetical protein LCGC14_2856080, partial [marine sediment metagenome]
MKPANSDTDTTFQVRPYREQDEPSVLDLLKSAYGDWPATTEMFRQGPAEFFRWKHLASPFGRSLMHVAEADDQIIGVSSIGQAAAKLCRLAFELAKRSKLLVIGIEKAAAKVAEARKKLAAAGLYGTRVT